MTQPYDDGRSDPTRSQPSAMPYVPSGYHIPNNPMPPYGTPMPYGAVPGYPPVPQSRPAAVTTAAALLIVFGLVGMLVVIGSAATSHLGESFEAVGQLLAYGIGVIGALLAVVAGIMLLVTRSTLAPILATIAAVALIFTCLGVIATIVVPVLLWSQQPAKAWFHR